jgi:tetraacyldisaccharide 4'-kinase
LIATSASVIYATVAAWRRRWYRPHTGRQQRLARLVISIGNLTVGGSGKTPIVAALARLFLAQGERPAILIRGYARTNARPGVTVVSDGKRLLESIETAGDEALMLGRALPSVPVLVGADRYASGRMAEEQLGVTVHLLDDGFQHVRLARDIDLVAVSRDDLDEKVLPAGRLREPLSASVYADAVLTPGDAAAADLVRRKLLAPHVYSFTRALGVPVPVAGARPEFPSREVPVVAVAGIARPQRFFDDLAADGWRLADTLVFPDHHPFSKDDAARMAAAAKASGAAGVLTTEKDAVRLEAHAGRLRDLAVASVPLSIALDPAFVTWLLAKFRSPRRAGGSQR